MFRSQSRKRRSHGLGSVTALVAAVALLGLLGSCGGDSDNTNRPSATNTPGGSDGGTTAPATPTPAPDLKLLKIQPDSGVIGTAFVVTGEGLPPGKQAEFIWGTVDGSWDMTVGAENVQFNKKVYEPSRMSLGKATVGADGTVTGSFQAPEDYGEIHDVFVAVDGEDLARGGFRIMRNATVSPESGPIGTPITIKVTGLGWKPFESTIALRYDNVPTGIITAVTTRGSATAVIRASGTTGKHVIDLNHGARSVPYLNNQQSGTAHIKDIRLWFNLTDDQTVPENSVDWPDSAYLQKSDAAAPRTTSSGATTDAGKNLSIEPSSGPILSNATVSGKDLKAGTEYELFWVTARGNRVSPSGWSLQAESVGKGTVAGDGTFTVGFSIPDDLGGWHVVRVASGETIVAEIPYYVERSLAGITPQVKAGETFEVHLKGVGWTELDNGVAITYDNAYIGFACGFNSGGDATVYLVATGEPGVHLIDLYPMIYQGHGEPPWGYQQAILTYLDDAPGLSIGYRLPAFRLAIEIVP